MATNTVIEQRQLRGSSDINFLQRVGIVYVDGREYRVLAPPKAVGDALDWIGHFSVRQPNPESFNSEILVEGAFRILALKLIKEELEKSKVGSTSAYRKENRKTKLRQLLADIKNFRSCGPSDDPDEQTSVIESYRYLLINVKAMGEGILPADVYEQLDAVPSAIETIYEVYESKAYLDAVCVDIEAELEQPSTMISGFAPAPAPEGNRLEKWHLVVMAAEVPTLKDMKVLPVSKQAQLLLRRLATRYPRSEAFGRMNFELRAHAADLASGYSPDEVIPVKNLLLGAPWKRLEADGLIRDNGQGFFYVTDEGYEAVKNTEVFFVNRDVIEALKLLHHEFQGYAHYFYEDKLQEAIAAAFDRYENRLNEIRDGSKIPAVMSASGHSLVYKLFETKILKEPYPTLGNNSSAKAAYEKGLTGIMSGGVSWLRNARTHEKHNLPSPTPQEALELLFVASYLMRLLDLSHR